MTEGTGQFVFSDLYNLSGIVRHVGIMHGRNLLIDSLRELFSRDREYHYVSDIFGYPKTPDHTPLDIDDGIENDLTTRLQIGTFFRYEQSYLPAISIRQTNITYNPISFNQNKGTVEYERRRTEDGFGNVDFISVPARYVYAGAWDQSFEIKIISNSQEDTASLADIVLVSLQSTLRDNLERHGLFIKQVQAGGEQSESTGNNDPIFTISITANTYSEWRREIPVANLLERIRLNFNFDFGSDFDVPATGLAIKYDITE